MRHLLRNCSFLLMALLGLVLMAATGIEKLKGTATMIYESWWFVALWALLAVCGTLYCLRQRLYRRPATGLLHLAWVIILAGACITHFWGEQGEISLRVGQPSARYVTEDHRVHQLPFLLTLKSFEVEYYDGTELPRDYISVVSAEGEELRIAMNQVGSRSGYRLFQSDYDPDLQGSHLLVSHDPWGMGVTYAGYALLFVSMLLMLILPHEGWRPALRQPRQSLPARGNRWTKRTLGLTFLLALGYLLLEWGWRYVRGEYLPPVLRSPLLAVHVGIIMVAYALLAVLFVSSLWALIKGGLTKETLTKNASLHNLEKLQPRNLPLLYPALFCLAAGIFVGAIWANMSWGRYWGWDPKEVWALITLLVYSLPMHAQSLPWFRRPRVWHTYMVVAFLTVLMTYFGVSLLLGGMHAYG